MFTKKRIIIAIISAVLVAVLAVGAVFIAGGLSEKKRVTEFKKNDKTSVTLKVNGKDMTFTYDHSKKYAGSLISDTKGGRIDVNQDLFLSEEGYTLARYEGSSSFYCLASNILSSKSPMKITAQEASELAYEMASDSDIVPDELLSGGSKLVRKVKETETTYKVNLTNDKGCVSVIMDRAGNLMILRISEWDTSRIPNGKKKVALASLEAFLAERNAASKGVHVLDSEEYHVTDNGLVALYSVLYYPNPSSETPDPMTDPHSAYAANFIV